MRFPIRRSAVHAGAEDGAQRRIDGAEQERAAEPHALEPLADDARLQRLDVDRDVGQLGHRRDRVARRAATRAR